MRILKRLFQKRAPALRKIGGKPKTSGELISRTH